MDINAQYKIIDKLGEGSFGTVYLAQDKATDTHVAIKSGDIGQNEAELQRTAASVGIAPKVYSNTSNHIIMEFIPGKTPTSDDVPFIHKQFACITALLDSLNIHHNDLSLRNLIYNDKIDKLYIIDFGISTKRKDAWNQFNMESDWGIPRLTGIDYSSCIATGYSTESVPLR